MEYIISAIIGYSLGSIPTAYLLLKKFRGIDITKSGTGNVGAMNSYEVSNSKLLGILVFLIDALKGLLTVYVPLLIFSVSFIYPAVALIFALISHCYNPWIKFKGGRGLATALGGSLLIFPFLPITWLLMWLLTYLLKKDIIFSNIFANILSLLLVFSTIKIAIKYTFPNPYSYSELILFTTALLSIIFVKHIDPMLGLFHEKNILSKEKGENDEE